MKKKRISAHRHNNNVRRQKMLESLLKRSPQKECVVSQPKEPSLQNEVQRASGQNVIIFQSELNYISRCILDCKNIETGGQLFGYYTGDGIPVVLYVIGPGPEANHQMAFFNQDRNYLVTVGRVLKDRYGLRHIGEWHSHHQLGLASPSGHDANTMISTVREKNLGCFLLCIGNCDNWSSTLNAFMCDERRCSFWGWDVIGADSPIRALADRALSGILVHPETTVASYKGMRSVVATPSRPTYAPGYWLNDKSNSAVLKRMLDYIKGRNGGADVHVRLNERGEVVLSVNFGIHGETILLPMGFPEAAPRITRTTCGRLIGSTPESGWDYLRGDIYQSFIRFYDTY